jgi:hypothetical protein
VLIKDVPEVSNEFTPQAATLHDLFTSDARGFYIPLYQRPYSWNSDNVEQLMEDLLKGVEGTLTNSKSVSFLGTVILCLEQNKQKNIEPVDVRALPGTVYNVIDGQQRISTLALLATRLYRSTFLFIKEIEGDSFYDEIVDYLHGHLDDLIEFFTLKLKTRTASPQHKPLVIRGSHDEWTLKGEDGKYTSPVSNYLAKFIRSIEEGGIDIPDRRTTLGRNLKCMDTFIDLVFTAHKQKETHISYPDAKSILKHVDQELVWKHDREKYYSVIMNKEYVDKRCSNVSMAAQIAMLYHYLFDRTCLSVIYPSSEDWAFDIFQSLNATGTPLTAIETFKPLVVNTVNRYKDSKYKGSRSEENFKAVDKIFETNDTAEKKSKLTKEFLNVFRLVYEGRSLSNHFSQQRKWLNETYGNFTSAVDQEEFVHRLSNLAKYWENVKYFDISSMLNFHGLSQLSIEEKKLSVLCVKYLDEASHRMADTLLSRFYAMVLRGQDQAPEKFVEAAKVVAAFFTIWRSAFSNTGLDDVYRKLLEKSDECGIPNYSWCSNINELDVDDLKKYFLKVLEGKGISSKAEWIEKAEKNLRYDNAKTVCKFALLVSVHDTISDSNNIGLMCEGAKGLNSCMDIESWKSLEFRTVEHIAPQKNDDAGWDANIYSDQVEHSIGNLTLLPVDINSSIGNKPWNEKVVYYKYLALADKREQQRLHDAAIHEGIELSEDTIELLTSATHASHVAPIVNYANAGKLWDKTFIEKRSQRICNILWDRMHPWLN